MRSQRRFMTKSDPSREHTHTPSYVATSTKPATRVIDILQKTKRHRTKHWLQHIYSPTLTANYTQPTRLRATQISNPSATNNIAQRHTYARCPHALQARQNQPLKLKAQVRSRRQQRTRSSVHLSNPPTHHTDLTDPASRGKQTPRR